ncbi:hypothetical protein DVH24_017834 [Malus domestica]|uniref:Uncharacterized protein n=1 Tax=Malus domestica TaxID=3750 RepID=A0A498KJL0_MALDO|nr:hypothetical protein DVH24_017834 [Malus domestica]
MSSSTHFRPGIGYDTKLSHPAPLRARPRPHGFVSGNSHDNFTVGHPSWDCSRKNSLNFGIPMEPEASELPKCLVLGIDENIHIRLT